MATDKDTIYVDIDDEITTIIDKVRSSDGKVVALVLPKRATVFQSVVNMKLLKRAAETAKKHIVLITTEANLMPLAGAVGLHVAPTPQSKPEIPVAVKVSDDADADESVEEDAFTADNAGDQPVGDLASRTGHVVGGAEETVAMDDPDAEDGDEPAKARKNRHLKVPNFNQFRLRLVLAGLLLVALVVGFYIANMVLPRAVIAISTNTSSLNVSIDPTLDTAATTLDTTKLIVPAKSEQQQKTLSKQVDATGEKNNGDKATGSIDMTGTDCIPFSGMPDVPAGTGVSTNGLTYITQDPAHFHFDHANGSCIYYQANNIAITAQTGGEKYNVSDAPFTTASRADVTGQGTTTGGTDDIVKVVSQEDIDGATSSLSKQDTAGIQSALEEALTGDGVYPLPTTFKTGKAKVSTDKNVGDEADTVTVTESITYTMLGAAQADLDALIKANVSGQIDTKNQNIVNDGLGDATITLGDSAGTKQDISIQTVATIGPNINATQLKQQVAGKRVGDVISIVNLIPGVTSVEVHLSPFWVSTVPTDAHQVTVTIKGH